MPHFGINQCCFPLTNCAAYSETVCDMLRLSVRLTPFYCAACAVFCKGLGKVIERSWKRRSNYLHRIIQAGKEYVYDHGNPQYLYDEGMQSLDD